MGMDTNEQGEMLDMPGGGDQGGDKPHPYPATLPRVIVVGNLTIDDVVLPDGTTRMSSVGGQ